MRTKQEMKKINKIYRKFKWRFHEIELSKRITEKYKNFFLTASRVTRLFKRNWKISVDNYNIIIVQCNQVKEIHLNKRRKIKWKNT